MKHLLSSALCAAILMSTAAPTMAGPAFPELNNSAASVLITGSSVVMVVSGPFFLAAAAANAASDASEQSSERRDEKRKITAGVLPDMKVKSVDRTAEGGRQVVLEDPTNTENTATLQWPQREDNPAANFTVGEQVAFTPSPQGSGWMLRAEDGAVLTYVPTAQAAQDSHSATL
jgi:predicted small lipoprotein YifL